MQERKRFYDDGIRFECQGDGKCCLNHGRHSYVYVTFNDRRRLADHLGMTTLEFTRRFTAASDGMVHLKDPDRHCPFFKDSRCGVHHARPWQCRTWPFWPENMHPKVWERDVVAFCPGVGRGRLYTAEEIEQIMAKRGDVAGCPSSQETSDR
jgi:Fe-S-cluster containining protein